MATTLGMPLRDQPWEFQQDNALAHTAKTTQAWLHNQSDFRVTDRPPTCPDESWIEDVWGIVAKHLQARTDLISKNFKDADFE
jgi:hypothetical protein